MTDSPDNIARINRVIDHIDAHLAEDLDLPTLAAVAHLSPWHFHRVFQALTGETLAERVRRRRLETAAARLLASPPESAFAIALDVGFGSAEVFTRAFRAYFGVTPTAWRRGASRAWAAGQMSALRKIHQADRKTNQAVGMEFLHDVEVWPQRRRAGDASSAMTTGNGEDAMTMNTESTKAAKNTDKPAAKTPPELKVEVRTLPETRVAYMRHVGPYGSSSITQMWMRFAAWCKEKGLLDPRPNMYGISQDSPEITPPEKCRYDACVPVGDDFTPEGEIGVQTIHGGRYACARFYGRADEIHDAWKAFLKGWLPGSRYQPDDHPAIELYEPDFAVDPETGAFPCWLCLPVRPL